MPNARITATDTERGTNTPILNAPNATVPGQVVSTGNIGTGNFGQVTSAQGARNIQFALKFHF